jgi:hypothetical protein
MRGGSARGQPAGCGDLRQFSGVAMCPCSCARCLCVARQGLVSDLSRTCGCRSKDQPRQRCPTRPHPVTCSITTQPAAPHQLHLRPVNSSSRRRGPTQEGRRGVGLFVWHRQPSPQCGRPCWLLPREPPRSPSECARGGARAPRSCWMATQSPQGGTTHRFPAPPALPSASGPSGSEGPS